MKCILSPNSLALAICLLIASPSQRTFADTISTSITQNGGVLTTSDGSLRIGSPDANNPAVLTLENGAQTTVTKDFYVGLDGGVPANALFGTVEVLSGSKLNTGSIAAIGSSLSVPDKTSGQVTVSGTDSTWTATGGLFSGLGGASQLRIENGGTVSASFLNLGASQFTAFSHSNSSVYVSGQGSKLVAGQIEVSPTSFSNAELIISDSATVEVSNKLSTNFRGVVNMNSGSLTAQTIENAGTIHLNDGTISTDSLKNSGTVEINGGTLTTKELATTSPLNFNDGRIIIDGGGLTLPKASNGSVQDLVINGNSLSANPTLEFRSTQSQQFVSSITIGDARNGSLVMNGVMQSILYGGVNIGMGSNSAGAVTIENGSVVNQQFGYANVVVGGKGTGTMSILSGSDVSQRAITVANSAGSHGDVIVDGENTRLKTGDFEVGREGVGTLLIQNGAQVETANAFIGGSSINSRAFSITRGTGNALVTGEDSTWNVRGSLGVGFSNGKLEVLDGATVTCDTGYTVATFVDAFSKTVVSGEGSTLQALHGFQVGSYEPDIANVSIRPIDGHATLVVENGAHLISQGIVGGLPLAEGLVVLHGGTLTGNDGFIVGNVSNWGGILSPGSSPGNMTIEGNYTQQPFSFYKQTGGTLQIELAGLTQGVTYDYLHVTGLTTLDGLLDLSFLDGFEHSILSTDTFTVLTSDGGLTGEFSNVGNDHRLDTRWGSFLVTYDAHSVVLSDFVAVPETSSLLLAGLGAAGVMGIAYRRRRSALLN